MMKASFLQDLMYYLSLICLLALAPPLLFAQSDLIQIGGGGFKHLNINVTTSNNDGGQVGENLLSEIGLLPNLNAASRFLGQATLGADYELIETVGQMGFSTWIDEQLAIPYTFSHKDFALDLTAQAYAGCMAYCDTCSICGMYASPMFFHFESSWMTDALESPDLLRARVAFAWSQIFVVSREDDTLEDNTLGLSDYYDMLSRHTFGNFRDLLGAVTLHPAMGAYLTYLNNPKSDPTNNIFPDENFAREIMQLFTIGLKKLNIDGSPQLDEHGHEIPTYNNADIQQLAKVFTGLAFWNATTFGQSREDIHSFTMPLQMWNEWHEPGEKQLIEGYTIPNRDPVNGLADIDEALDHLFQHPNVGPFISHKLIQRLVTNNPSPAYIARVATAFNDNGQGVRGDMKAVIKAILLDPEARDCNFSQEDEHGKLREPMIRYTNLLRAFNVSTPSGNFRCKLSPMVLQTKQRPLGSPSVFNFYSPDFSPSGLIQGAGKVAPEFEIFDANGSIGYINMVQTWLFSNSELLPGIALYAGESQSLDYDNLALQAALDVTDEVAIAYDEQMGDLVERLNLILAHGQLSFATINSIIEAIRPLPDGGAIDYRLTRVKLAIFLVMTSPEYLIIK